MMNIVINDTTPANKALMQNIIYTDNIHEISQMHAFKTFPIFRTNLYVDALEMMPLVSIASIALNYFVVIRLG